ncbi:hypothetical protein Ancab_034093, partial [Ancistrocladus abbreviatus]
MLKGAKGGLFGENHLDLGQGKGRRHLSPMEGLLELGGVWMKDLALDYPWVDNQGVERGLNN